MAVKLSWQRLSLAAILLLAAFLNLFRLTSLGYSNTYYAAAVKDMLTSWHNFFFLSFDAGFVSVDKPPLGLWSQAASTYLFGFTGPSLLLPQALAGVLSVALLYYLVSRAFGQVAGLVAALALALAPIAVAVSRTNEFESLLVLTVLVAAWAVIRAAETGQLRWLLLGAVVVGLGFNIKMLEAYLVLPAFYLLYLLAAPVSWWRRFVHLGIATMVLVVVSLSWAVAVDLTPADQRPYVGGSSNNSELNLIVDYNGVNHLTGSGGGGFGAQGGGGPRENGDPGPLRLLDEQLAGQVGWLLPLAVVGLLAASWQTGRPHLPLNRRQGALVLWGAWLLTQVVLYSTAGTFHRYYLVTIAPAIAALVGAGVVALWSDYRKPGWRGWLLPLTLLGMAALHAYIILADYDEDWTRWLTPAIVGLSLVAALGLVFMRLRPGLKVSTYSAGVVVAVGILALLLAPTAWAAYTVWQVNGRIVAAGPQPTQGQSAQGSSSDTADPALLDYLQANRGDARYLVAASNSMSASPIILNTDASVISTGGYSGRDPVLSVEKATNLVNEGALRFFLIPGQQQSGSKDVTSWVQNNCAQVPQELWQSSTSSEQSGDIWRAQLLYDCSIGDSRVE